jgi:proteic killer suppression protein
MLKTFHDKDSEKIWEGKVSRKYSVEIQQRTLRKLFMLDKAQALEDLRIPPANRLESLTGERTGQYSIRVNDQWRLCFSWKDGNAENVELVDYHEET